MTLKKTISFFFFSFSVLFFFSCAQIKNSVKEVTDQSLSEAEAKVIITKDKTVKTRCSFVSELKVDTPPNFVKDKKSEMYKSAKHVSNREGANVYLIVKQDVFGLLGEGHDCPNNVLEQLTDEFSKL
jgi:hypothetical protein